MTGRARRPAITGLNHLTLCVADLDQSVAFYRDCLGCELRSRGPRSAYLGAGNLWLCLELSAEASRSPRRDDSHIAFSVAPEDFGALSRAVEARCPLWKSNKSEGSSIYFLDPDGHRLELHVGSLETRLDHYRANPELGVRVIED
ncbi:MAG: VOC family protein [Pseudomonadota bacterium]